jgi:hypothetical protein
MKEAGRAGEGGRPGMAAESVREAADADGTGQPGWSPRRVLRPPAPRQEGSGTD